MSHIAIILVGTFLAAVLVVTLALCKAARLGDEAQRLWDKEMERRTRAAVGRNEDDDDTTRTWTSGDEGRA
jgi:hypothetical protein